MSRISYSTLVILPLMSFLAMSPKELMVHTAQRSIASIDNSNAHSAPEDRFLKPGTKLITSAPKAAAVPEKFPEYKLRAEQVDRDFIRVAPDLSVSQFKEHRKALETKLETEKLLLEDFKEGRLSDQELQSREKRLEFLVGDMVALEEDVKALQDKHANSEPVIQDLDAVKSQLEEVLAAKNCEDETEVVASVPLEDKKEEAKPEVKTLTGAELDKAILETSLCELEEKNSVLTAQVEKMLADQNDIMKSILNLTQAVMNLTQQRSPYYSNSIFGNQLYPQQQMLLPQGYAIVPATQIPQEQSMKSFYPDQIQPQQAPALQYQPVQPVSSYMQYDARYTPMSLMPGSFGIEPFTYNFGQNPALTPPTASQSFKMM